MAEEVKCACGSANVAIFPCSGASNVDNFQIRPR